MFGYFTLSRGGPEPKTCGSVHCGSLLVKKDEHLRKDERMKGQNRVIKCHQVDPSNRDCMARPW